MIPAAARACQVSLALMMVGFAQTPLSPGEQATAAAEAERKVMEETFAEVVELAGAETPRGKMFQAAQEQWISYVKEQAAADADKASGEVRYPSIYFQTMRDLTRYRTRALETSRARLRGENPAGAAVAGQAAEGDTSENSGSARDWRAEVGQDPLPGEVTLFSAELDGNKGILAGQWKGEDLWRGNFLSERGDGMVLYGGRLQRGGVVFEAWQESSRIGRGFLREEEGVWSGRFFDERRRETPILLTKESQPKPVSYDVGLTTYSGLVGTEEAKVQLEWHDTRYVRGKVSDGNATEGHNYAGGKLFLTERASNDVESPALAFWSLAKSSSGGRTRWRGTRKDAAGVVEPVEFSR